MYRTFKSCDLGYVLKLHAVNRHHLTTTNDYLNH